MPLVVFARFHARQGDEEAVANLMRKQIVPVRAEPGCLAMEAFRSTRDPRLFYFHSRWVDESAFDRHAVLPHTVHFLERIQPLIDHPLDVARTQPLGQLGNDPTPTASPGGAEPGGSIKAAMACAS